MNRFTGWFLAAALAVSLSGCSAAPAITSAGSTASAAASSAATASGAVTAGVSTTTKTVSTTASAAPAGAAPASVIDYDDEDLAPVAAANVDAEIKLAGGSITTTGSGVKVDGATATITAAGAYRVSGELKDGQIVVDVQDTEEVVLVLDGADITSTTGAPIYVAGAKKVILTLAEGSENTVTDGSEYVYPDGETTEPDAAIFSHDDLTINGAGSLAVNANYQDGITSKDDLIIAGGQITVMAADDAVKGRDSLAVKDGVLTVQAGSDGLKASNDEDPEQGYVVIDGGTIDITAREDGIQGETSVTINAGVLRLATGDDAIHAENTITVNGGNVRISESYEGVEAEQITINSGEVRVVSDDDAVNAVPAGTTASAGGGMPGGGFGAGGNSSLTINGGYLAVDAGGDGLDINGSITMTGGVVLVNGPTENMNGPIDYDGTFNITGGFLVAAGSAGMAQAPSASSTQYSVMHVFSTTQAAGTVVTLQSQVGEEIATFVPTKTFQSFLVSSPDLAQGGTYLVLAGGKTTGAVVDSLATGGAYTGGQQAASYTLNSVVTGAAAGGMMGGPGGRGGMRPPRP